MIFFVLGMFALMLIPNIILYGVPIVALRALGKKLDWPKGAKEKPYVATRNAVLLVVACMFAIPLVITGIHDRKRARLTANDIAPTRLTEPVRDLALLLEPKWELRQYTTTARTNDVLDDWAGFVLSGRVNSILIGVPPVSSSEAGDFTDDFSNVQGLARYRIEKKPWCPLVEGAGGRYGPTFTELTQLALGHCIVRDAGKLSDADTVLALRWLLPVDPYTNRHPALSANRFELWRIVGGSWQATYRETHVAGTDLVGPLLITDAIEPHWARTDRNRLEPIDVSARLTPLGLQATFDREPSRDELRDLVRRIVTDPAIPRETYQISFLEGYFAQGPWSDKDIPLIIAILQDERVRTFDFPTTRQQIPTALARPLADRILRLGAMSPVTPPGSYPTTEWTALKQVGNLADLLQELPPCELLQVRQQIMEAWSHEAWRYYLSELKRALDANIADKRCNG